jgi:RNA polymerase sigma-70 factor (ECF subfamily)
MNQAVAPQGFPLEEYREYLRVLAQLRLKSWLNDKIDPSDVVQQALLKAYQHRDQFRGQNQAEWRAYLRSILANTVADAISALPREKAIQNALDQSSARLEAWLVAEQSSPSQKVQREEMLLRLAEALTSLSNDERAALELRYFQEPPWSLADIAGQLNRPSAKAVAGLLARGLAKLRELLRDDK